MTIVYYIIAAILEIIGCYLFAKGEYPLGVICLLLFAWSLSLVPIEPIKAYVTYGGVYILFNILLAYVTGVEMHVRDWVGAGLLLLAIIIML